MVFASIRGITVDPWYREELAEMYNLYKESKNNKEFTKKMTNAGYGKLN